MRPGQGTKPVTWEISLPRTSVISSSWSHLQATNQALVLIGEALGICVLALVDCGLEPANIPHGAIQRPLSQRHTQSLQADEMRLSSGFSHHHR